ncbi:membrane protein insertase YidC, partial [Corynebacterium stationis]|uniref:membrane protein insertase YidC n=1 Tax=Corynebacterium stationis TaxID=1705 RepID=UPI003F4DEE01
MLNFIYWPISFVLYCWHWLLSLVLDPAAGITWILAIILLTWTLKAIMVKPTLTSLRSQRKMQELQPRLQEVRSKYANDKTKQAEEMQKVYKDAKVRPMAGCLPMLAQVPMFIGLFHVLRSFDRTVSVAGGIGHPAGEPMSLEMNRSIGNYFFNPEQVQSYLDAELFGV